MNQELYPLWGASALWQLQICRKGFLSLPLASIPGLWHQPRNPGERYGVSIVRLLRQSEERKSLFIRTPPLVSVVIPCYNYGRFIADAVNSLVGGPTSLGTMAGQTFQSFEVIIVDDGSDLETQEQLAAVTNGWKGIKLIRQTNKGTAGANNSGIQFAIGKYITIQAADDMREPWSLQDLYDAIQQRPHQYVYDAPTYFSKGRRGKVATLQPYDCQALPERNMVPAGIMFPREAWVEAGGYRERMIYGREDWAFNIALAIAGWHGHKIDRSGYLYRREAHNRSLANAELRDLFKLQIEQIFPGINREAGMCCNDKRTYMGKQNGPVAPRTFSAASVPQGMTLLEYVGGNVGSQSWGGPGAVPSNRYYVFGRNPKDQVKYVDTRDVPMLLSLRENSKHIFRVYKAVEEPATQPQPEKLGMGAIEVKQDAPVVTLPATIPVPATVETVEVEEDTVPPVTIETVTIVEEPATPKKRFDPTRRKAARENK